MHRFFSPIKNISDDKIIINDNEQIHHIRDVLHLQVDDEVILFDEKGNIYQAIIEEITGKEIILKIKIRQKRSHLEKDIIITVACAIPKNAKMDDIVDKLTQLGVNRIIPMRTERVIVKLDKTKETLRLARWKKIALSAAEQSQRNNIPLIEPIKNIAEVFSEAHGYGLKLILALIGDRKSMSEVIAKNKFQKILILIGPEGDFTLEEVNLAKRQGFIPVTLGDLVLRVDTAAVAAASFARLYTSR